jgi:alpha-beta hydrolase superfamily lysophospholipase
METNEKKNAAPPVRSRLHELSFPLLAGAAAFFGAEFGRRFYRDSRIFAPSPDPVKSWDPADYGIPREAFEEHWIRTSDGQTLHAWYCRAPVPRASALFCHGNTGNLTVSADIIPHLLSVGLSVLFFDYRGYGKSTGRATVRGVLRDAQEAALLHDRLRPHDRPALLYGYSLGGAIAAQLARTHPFDGLILQSTFTSLPRLTRLLHPGLPLHLVAGRVFDTLSVVRELKMPLLIMHGTADETVPCAMADEIFDACATDKHLVRVEGGMHRDLYHRDPAKLTGAIDHFLRKLERRTNDAGGSDAMADRE